MAEPLSFIDNLSEEQRLAAIAVAEEAKKMGINPRLAVSIAFREGGLNFNSKDGSSGEIGMMQVMPSTGKMMGYTEEDLRDPQKNVEIGLTYLKQGLDKFNDPYRAAAGYNAGMDHKFFQDPEKHSLPESTVNYLKDINKFGGFTDPAPQVEADSGELPEEATPASEEDFSLSRAKQMFGDLTAKDVAGAAGAATGAYLGPKVGAGIASMQPPTPTGGEKWAKNWAGQNRPGLSVPEASAAYQRSKGQGKVSGRVSKMYGPRPPVEPGKIQTGRLDLSQRPPPSLPLSTGEKFSAFDKGLTQFGNKAAQVGNALLNSPVGKVATGALGGYGAATQGMDAAQRLKQGDKTGAAISGAGALGSAIAAIPTPVTRIGGTALGAASPAALWMLEHSRKMSPANAQDALQRTDPMGNPVP
jgi:hypothetical protein